MSKDKTVALVSLGCAKNLVDSEVMLGFLRDSGYRPGTSESEADALVVNTCGFIEPARREAERAIRRALRFKGKNPGLRVVVAGCYVERCRADLEKRYPGVDSWLGVKSFDQIARAVKGEDVRPGSRTFLYSHDSPRLTSTPSGWAYLKISEGCSHACSFCAIPSIKGPYRSRPVASILREARRLASSGAKEINLVSQDSTRYGFDLGLGRGLAGLLEELGRIRELSWVRVLYGYPEEVSAGLLEAMKGPRICRYFDLPFQHAAPAVLKAMGRGLGGDRALDLMDRIRRVLPDAVFRTSLIVGFPGEGRREFQALRDFVRRARFEHLGVFPYSSEAGTAAQALGDPVPEEEKAARRDELMAVQQPISLEHNKRMIGQRLEVLLEGRDRGRPGRAVGRWRGQAPEVDGLVRVSSANPLSMTPPSIRRVEITGAGVYDLRGRVIE